jgi:hypothetical protein
MGNIQLDSGMEARAKAMPGAMLECAVCTGQKFHELNETNLDELRCSGAIGLECSTCKRKTYWLYGAHGGVATPAVRASQLASLNSSELAPKGHSDGHKLYQSERRTSAERRSISRRHTRRVALQLPVRLRVNSTNTRFEEVTRTVNTCKTGIYFHSEQPYAKGASALVAMNFNPREAGMTMDQRATVVRIENIPGSHMRGVAMQFQ